MRLKIQQPPASAADYIPAPSPSTTGDGSGRWNSPIPYIFSGLALTLAVVVAAVILLVCSYMRSYESSVEKTEKQVQTFQPEIEPRVVVIMAGETNPTHLAKPVAAIIPSTEDVI